MRRFCEVELILAMELELILVMEMELELDLSLLIQREEEEVILPMWVQGTLLMAKEMAEMALLFD